MADDPLLTDRSGRPRRRKLLRVIVDSYLRIPLTSRVVQTAENDVLVLCSTAEEPPRRALEAKGIRVEQISATADGRPDFAAIVQRLGELEITSLLVEGGALVNGAALGSGEVDKVFLYYAPKIFGEGAVPFLAGESLHGEGAARAAFRVAPLRRRLRAGRLSARPVRVTFVVILSEAKVSAVFALDTGKHRSFASHNMTN